MTTVAQSEGRAARRGAGGGTRRLAGLLRTEARLLWRLRVVAAAVGVTVLWVAVLRFAPPDARGVIVPAVLLTDVAALGFLFIPALLVLERTEGVAAALHMTPVRPLEPVAVRLGVTTALSLVAAAVVCAAGGVSDVGVRLLGVGLLSVLFGLVACVLTMGAETLTAFLLRAPLVAAPLVAPALIALVGLTDASVLHVSPVTSAVALLRGEVHVAGTVWQAVWIVGLVALVDRVAARPAVGVRPHTPATAARTTRRRAARSSTRRCGYSVWSAVRSLARVDRRSLLCDGLLLLLVASVPLVAAVMRIVATWGVDWVGVRHGVALAPYLPLIEALLLVVHTPVIFGTLTGLLLLEDRDAGLFGPLQATRSGLATMLGYRLGATAAATAVALLVTLPFDGVPHAAGLGGVVATAVGAGAVSTVPALAMAALAANRVQGVAVMKLLGLPLYVPLVTWVVAPPASWLAAPVPTTWLVQATWAPTMTRTAAFALGTVVVSLAWSIPLARRTVRRARAI